MDSNHRRHKPADLQSAPFGRSGILRIRYATFLFGAGDGTRTRDRLITNQVLYRLSYASIGPQAQTYKRTVAPRQAGASKAPVASYHYVGAESDPGGRLSLECWIQATHASRRWAVAAPRTLADLRDCSARCGILSSVGVTNVPAVSFASISMIWTACWLAAPAPGRLDAVGLRELDVHAMALERLLEVLADAIVDLGDVLGTGRASSCLGYGALTVASHSSTKICDI